MGETDRLLLLVASLIALAIGFLAAIRITVFGGGAEWSAVAGASAICAALVYMVARP